MRRPLVAVVGDANLDSGYSTCDAERKTAAEAVGRALVDAGARVVTGGYVRLHPRGYMAACIQFL